MKTFIGTKTVKATPMNRLDYITYRGWELPDDEDGTDEGMLVEYVDGGKSNHPDHKGYISWSPLDVFERSYKETKGLSLGAAIEAVKLGHKIARSGWNGNNMFVYYVPAAKYKAITSVMMDMAYENGLIPYNAYLAIRTTAGPISTWSPSCSDTLAEDWYIVE